MLELLASAEAGLSASEAQAGCVLRPERARGASGLGNRVFLARQVRNPLLLLLLAAAAVSGSRATRRTR